MSRFSLTAVVVLAAAIYLSNTAVFYAAEKGETAGSVLLKEADTLFGMNREMAFIHTWDSGGPQKGGIILG